MDRALIILGRGLKELGHTVYVMANRYDRKVVEAFASTIIDVPANADDYLNLNEHTARWMEDTWEEHFSPGSAPDVVLIGGWPFFASIPFLRKACGNVVFMDCGAVPLDGLSGGGLAVQEKLRSLRKQYLKELSLIISISDFIASSQSKADAGPGVPVKTILLGGDHMDMAIWPSDNIGPERQQGQVSMVLGGLKDNGKRIVLCLGRWEPGGYKNSGASFDVFRGINKEFGDCVLLVLSDPAGIRVPADLRESVIPIGLPDDAELTEAMKSSDLGISLSLWEGFNLPIAEMQWLDRPVLAFNTAAHPEVIAHSWYLCRDGGEMALKAREILGGGGAGEGEGRQSRMRFRDHFKWERVVKDYEDIFLGLAEKKPLSIIVDVTNASRDPANSGVVRVTRRLGRDLQGRLSPIFVVWDEASRGYVLPTKKEFEALGRFNGPVQDGDGRVSPDGRRIALRECLGGSDTGATWLLFTETVNEGHARIVRRFAKDNGIRLAAIFYDAIPVLHPDLCKDRATKDNHRQYMEGLSECDVVIPISGYSAECLERFWKDNHMKGCKVVPDLLPGEFGGAERPIKVKEHVRGGAGVLCVSTLEPRKNHRRLIEACLLMQEKHPELEWKLTLVGNRYAGADDIVEHVKKASAQNPRIEWLGIVDDDTLHRLYGEAAFTVYPSVTEGFGMPILESVWHGKPCICSGEGVMAELAADGGCLTTDVTDVQALSGAIYRLATDRELYDLLSKQAAARNIKTWDDYTSEFISILRSTGDKGNSNVRNPGLAEALYPQCLCDNWQMNDSERLAVAAILSRRKPRCSIEVGTYKGGSLSLITQHSGMVFSIDIDPEIPKKFGYFKNACFLTGPSASLLPLLLEELKNEGIPVDFILIDGDHSREGVRTDINNLLSYVPESPLFVVMHDSFNPGCRRGMLEADWDSSPYVHFVDIDFIPGRVDEHDGPSRGELWGGLALAYLRPEKRQAPLKVGQSARGMFEMLNRVRH